MNQEKVKPPPVVSEATKKNQELAQNLCKELGSATYQLQLMARQRKAIQERVTTIHRELDALERVTREINKDARSGNGSGVEISATKE